VHFLRHREGFPLLGSNSGPEKVQTLPMFHALTGCNMVSCLDRHGEKTVLAVWTALPDTQSSSHCTGHIDENAMNITEMFIILLYDRTSAATDIDKACLKQFAKKSNVQLIPPTSASLEHHVQRVVYQGGTCLGSGPGSCNNIATTDRLGLDQDQRCV